MEIVSRAFPIFNEILKKNRESKKKNYSNEIKIAFLRNSTVERVIPFLEFLLFSDGIKAVFYFSEYENYYQEILNPESGLNLFKPDLIFVSLDTRLELEEIYYDFNSLESQSVQSKLLETKNKIEKIIDGIKKNHQVPIVLHGFEIPFYPSLGLYDSQNIRGQLNSIRRLNLDLVDFCSKLSGLYFLDLELVLSRAGGPAELDHRFWYTEKNPYSHTALKELAKEYFSFIQNFKGKMKKCLIVDLDNTLWGGIIGEDGFNGIKLGNSYPGSAFIDFQRSILNLYKRGIILAICSKNNLEDVLEVLKNHPDMVLREHHFAIIKANWNNKAQNIRDIATELNIGLDSLVFIDDNPFEVNLVQSEIPEVMSLLLPKENPTNYKSYFEKLFIFNGLTLSEEDKNRSEMYRQETKRKSVQTEFSNVDDYLKSLEMKVTFSINQSFTASRVAQLSQRTNQFNLTTIRYNDEDIQSLIDSPDADVLAVKLEDRFGDLGIIGAAILKYHESSAVIDSLMISCRALGRGVEDAIAAFIYRKVYERGKIVIQSEYRSTNKNSQVKNFYDKRMFELLSSDETFRTYSVQTAVALTFKIPEYISISQE